MAKTEESGLVRVEILRAIFVKDKDNPDNGKRINEGELIDLPTDEAIDMIESGAVRKARSNAKPTTDAEA